MATPAATYAPNAITTSVTATSLSASSSATPPIPNLELNLGPGLYLKEGESIFFMKWLTRPHPDILIEAVRALCAEALSRMAQPPFRKMWDDITPEQERRFSFVAQKMDIMEALAKLEAFREDMVELYEEHMTIMEETMGMSREEASVRLSEDMARRELAGNPRPQTDTQNAV